MKTKIDKSEFYTEVFNTIDKEATEYAYKAYGENVMQSLCGFAWINIKPANSDFAKWLVKKELARKDVYYGGVTIWVGKFNQSIDHKEAYADMFADRLRKYFGSLKIHSNSRLD